MLQIIWSNPSQQSHPHPFHIHPTATFADEQCHRAYLITYEDMPVYSEHAQQLLYLYKRQ